MMSAGDSGSKLGGRELKKGRSHAVTRKSVGVGVGVGMSDGCG